ncbi:hypothetical protein WH95_19830 [Kiloniella litopenaei]|uniref:Uncharacterized protein n=1 Tax=Kiloniella litopenaei TaxID=1549748 RepID=A0A0M2QZX0_9PROT|nr:hypothetical protein [Kiloniella litopenaei]KKJ75172.1 hypothetical protein WH95_19830 [Kiloniella litopenaei]
MAFRADEAERNGIEKALGYLVPKGVDPATREECKNTILDIIDECGPVVSAYPSWHPIVSYNKEVRSPVTTPGERCGYKGLDHTIYFVNGFITCPYTDGKSVMSSVDTINNSLRPEIAYLSAEKLDVNLYNSGTASILVRCHWGKLGPNKTIPKSLALPLLLERELLGWEDADYGETWETMRPYFLGMPHGSRSSLFLDQETGQALKKIWNAIIQTGMYGPIMVGR